MFSDTKEETINNEERPVQTLFYFDSSQQQDFAAPELVGDVGGHEPPREDGLFTPFYPDASKRLLVPTMGPPPRHEARDAPQVGSRTERQRRG